MNSVKQRYLLFFIVFLCFLGRGVLAYFGYNMGTLAKNTFTKIHPLTYLVFFLYATKLIYAPRKLLNVNRAVKIYFFSVVVAVIYLISTGNGKSISFLADTLLMPALFYSYAKSLNPKFTSRLPQLALSLIFINSFIAIIERLRSKDFFPIEIELGSSFRATALLGHPLNNGLITFIFILYVLISDFSILKKNIYLGLLLVALICFGARGCIYASAAAIFFLYIFPLLFSKARYFVRTNRKLALFILGVAVSLIVVVVLDTSFGERLLSVSFFDQGSAGVRVKSLNLIDFSEFQDFLWARSQTKIDYMSSEAGVDIIENFIIVWGLRFGLVFTAVLLSAMSYFFIKCSEVKNKRIMLLVTLLFLGAAATNNSLAGNTEAIMIFVIVFMFPSQKHKFVF